MKILYLTTENPYDINAWSGTIVAVRKALESAGNEIILCNNLHIPRTYALILKIYSKLSKKHVDVKRQPYVLKSLAKQLSRCTKKLDYDIIFCISSLICPYYKDDKKIVYYTDACFASMLDYYFDSSKWTPFSIENGHNAEKLSMINSDKIILTSQWAVNSAIDAYDISPTKFSAINIGSNLYHSYNSDDLLHYFMKRNTMNPLTYYKFLFVGRDWKRKGGALALSIVKELNYKGYPSKLIIIGTTPKLSDDEKNYVNFVGFLDKSKVSDITMLEHYYLESDFYIQPSIAECQAVSYAEASAFGLPCIATDTGGISDIVNENNGHLLLPNDDVNKYIEVIEPYLLEPQKYFHLAQSAFEYYKTNLNWNVIGEKISQVLLEL